MRILVAGGDGFCGCPAASYLSARGHEVAVADGLGTDSSTETFDSKVDWRKPRYR